MDQSAGPATGHKTYVFVDEYNRHKRLKVMRACDGCRKRKIRCDGALQNGPWPCGACQRLKLKCIPPTLDADDEQQTPDSATGPGQFSFQTAAPTSSARPEGIPSQPPIAPEWNTNITPVSSTTPSTSPMRHEMDPNVYSSQLYSQQLGPRVNRGLSDEEYFASATAPVQFHSGRPAVPSLIRTQTEASSGSPGDPHDLDATVRELSEQMGDLAIDVSSAAPYIANEKRNLAETPAMEEDDIVLPPSVSSDLTVTIPPEMMPTEERAMDYFGYFFDYVHPYVPVLNRAAFYDQWRNARHSISPLILEGVFACVARYLESTIEVRKWLALASRHEESFKDVPRVSTVQALIILTKAREFVPRRGYYYRSWMAVKYMTTMGFDLGLQDHYDKHRMGGTLGTTCTLNKAECIVRTRMWQILFGLEVWVGAPQGRTDFAVDYETVDFDLPTPSPEVETYEYEISRRTTYLAQAIQNIKQTNSIWQSMRRKKKDWALDPAFTSQNDVIAAWIKTLPTDMQIHYTDDETPPYLGGDHFVANLHIYHHLIVIMQHRPQLQTLLELGDSSFKEHLDICNESASLMCRLHEALYRDFGLHGLQFMQRGFGFAIYSILTCTMLHLATITSPDPVTNARARNFFTRHMRILERCAPSATPEVQVQINALREAFSQDTSQPFELKPSLGLRSPSMESQSTPPALKQSQSSASGPPSATWTHVPDSASSRTISPGIERTPPFDTTQSQPPIPFNTTGFAVPTQAAYAPANVPPPTSTPQSGYVLEPVLSNETTPVWDPSGIFQQWNTAFGAQAQTTPLHHPHGLDPRVQQHLPAPTSQPQQPLQHPPPLATHQPMYPAQQTPSTVAVPVVGPGPPVVTPVMWQNAFTNAYVSGHGHKRHRDESVDYGQYVKRRG